MLDGKVRNIVDPDQTASKKQSDLGLHCLQMHFNHHSYLMAVGKKLPARLFT